MKAKKPSRKSKPSKAKEPPSPVIRIDMKVESVPLPDLLPSAVNARTHSPKQVAQIVASIIEFGFTNPVLIDPANEIIAGHGRALAAHELKMPVVPCIRLGHLTPEQVRAYRLADNKIALNSGWDEAKLKAEIEALQKLDFDVQLTGFTAEEIAEMIGGVGDGGYSRKITIPIYEPKGEKPALSALVNQDRTQALIAEIEASDAEDDEKTFLIQAAQRHLAFDYHSVAEYYCHATPEVQRLMEKSALVIIDFEKAIENGYVELSKKMSDIYAASFGENEKGESKQ